MFVRPGARVLLLESERRKFLSEQWPAIRETIQRLGLTPEELLDATRNRRSESDATDEER
jgi:GntR family transcriptional regulator